MVPVRVVLYQHVTRYTYSRMTRGPSHVLINIYLVAANDWFEVTLNVTSSTAGKVYDTSVALCRLEAKLCAERFRMSAKATVIPSRSRAREPWARLMRTGCWNGRFMAVASPGLQISPTSGFRKPMLLGCPGRWASWVPCNIKSREPALRPSMTTRTRYLGLFEV